MDDERQSSTQDGPAIRLEERIATIEKAVVILPAIAAEALLILSLFLPFVTVTSNADDDRVINLFQLGFALFGGVEGEETDGAGALFAIAFLVLVIVVLCSIVGIAFLARGRLSRRGAGALTTFGVLLVLGAAGAWLVIALGSTSESPWLPEAGSLTLVAGALLVAALTFLPTFRSIWMRR